MMTVTAEHWADVIRTAELIGRCPACGAEVECFATMFTPAGEILVGCDECGLPEAAAEAAAAAAAARNR